LATAERIAHSLKGAAGTLGATALSEAAAMVEAAIKNGGDVHSAVEALSHALDEAVQAIAVRLPDPINMNGAELASMNSATVNVVLGRLKHLLESDDGEAADFIIDARASLVGVLTAEEIETLSVLVGHYDVEGSLSCIAGIAERLELRLESP
jgi:HPt (histidine-containing phosphotransfer) domain-containing protein